jgi:3-isopropylmalate/(R)-2-methylmalate dehydratase small subunit
MDPITVIEGPVADLPRDDVDTDQIIPKQFLKRVERTGYGEFLFFDWDEKPARAPILVTGRNFGCGSSREHAPWALEDFGYRAIVAPSFADIFRSNSTKVGLLPVELPEEQCRELARRGRARIDLAAQTADEFPFAIDPEVKHRLLNGLDDIALTLQQADAIAAYEATRERRGPDTLALAARP